MSHIDPEQLDVIHLEDALRVAVMQVGVPAYDFSFPSNLAVTFQIVIPAQAGIHTVNRME